MLREMQKTLATNGQLDADLTRAIDLVHAAGLHNNEAIKDDERREQLYAIQAKLGGTTIVTPGRRCVKVGDVQKVGRRGHKPYKLILLVRRIVELWTEFD